MNTPATTQALRELACPLCGSANHCAAAASGSFAEPCWCREASFAPELLARVPEKMRGRACICPACARFHQQPSPPNSP